MNAARYQPEDYVQFLIASSGAVSCVEAARVQPSAVAVAHDAVTRMLTRVPPDPAAVWADARGLVERERGVLVVDDTTLDKPHGRHIDLVTRHWSGTHKRIVWGINLTTLVWTDGVAVVPVDVRVYAKATDGLTKNAHLRHMLTTANERGFTPRFVLFDSWYSGLENLKHIRRLGWSWMCRIKCNRLVDPDRSGNVAVGTLEIPAAGLEVHLKGYGLVRVFRTVAPDGHAEYWASDDLTLTEPARAQLEAQAWGIETYHRGLKQCCGIARCQVRSAAGQFQHLLCAVRAFLRLEAERLRTGLSWYAAKRAITRDAVRHYLAQPCFLLPQPATA
jgi:putative transposase